MKNDIVKYNRGEIVKHVGKAISTANKILALSDRQKIVSFFRDSPDFFINFISKFYPLNEKYLENYSGIWNWELMSLNETLIWSDKLIEKYSPLWNWDFLAQNGSVPWKNGLVEKYQNKLDWNRLSSNETFPSSKQIVEKYFDNWDWQVLSQNKGLPWSIEFIDSYKSKLNWSYLSENRGLPWSGELIDKYLNDWNWGKLSRIFPFSEDLVTKYQDQINWNSLSWNNRFMWNSETLKKCQGKGNKMGLLYTFPFSIDILEKYKDRESALWQCLSLNINLPWSLQLLRKYENCWDWESIGYNNYIPWSLKILEEFKAKWIYTYMHENVWPNMSGHKSLWEKVFKGNVDDSMIEESLKECVNVFEDNKYFLKKLDDIYGEIDFVLGRLESSTVTPKSPWMFVFLGVDDVFDVIKRLGKVLNRYSFWLSKEIYTTLIALNSFLQESCKGFNRKTVTREQLRNIGARIYDTAESFRVKLMSCYDNDIILPNILNTLNRVNQFF